jgi:hypothetical protein
MKTSVAAQELTGHSIESQYRAFVRFFTIHTLVFFVHLVVVARTADGGIVVSAAVLTLTLGCALLCWARPALVPPAMALLVGVSIAEVWINWPGAANHLYLFVLIAAIGATFRSTNEREQAVAVASWTGLALIVFFLTGLQKLLHGTYFNGQFMGIYVEVKSGFGWFIALIAPEELTYYETLVEVGVGTGPYDTHSPVVRVLSNSVWVFEMAAPLALLWARWRIVWLVASMVFVLSIQFAAREFIFGLAFSSLLSLMLPMRWSIRWLQIATVASSLLLVFHLVAPDFHFN